MGWVSTTDSERGVEWDSKFLGELERVVQEVCKDCVCCIASRTRVD